MKQSMFFRLWYYFRNGWSTYFAFIFAAINTLTVTYFLAIEEYPFLYDLFPTFVHYIVIVSSLNVRYNGKTTSVFHPGNIRKLYG